MAGLLLGHQQPLISAANSQEHSYYIIQRPGKTPLRQRTILAASYFLKKMTERAGKGDYIFNSALYKRAHRQRRT